MALLRYLEFSYVYRVLLLCIGRYPQAREAEAGAQARAAQALQAAEADRTKAAEELKEVRWEAERCAKAEASAHSLKEQLANLDADLKRREAAVREAELSKAAQ
eukprot:1183449-Prorocentrum_minimum.AAC.3